MREGRVRRAFVRISRAVRFALQPASIQTGAALRPFAMRRPAPSPAWKATQSRPDNTGKSLAQSQSACCPIAHPALSPPFALPWRSGARRAAGSTQAGLRPRCRRSTTTAARAPGGASGVWRSRAASANYATRDSGIRNSSQLPSLSPLVPQSLSPCSRVSSIHRQISR
jgi:hypothetical protein